MYIRVECMFCINTSIKFKLIMDERNEPTNYFLLSIFI